MIGRLLAWWEHHWLLVLLSLASALSGLASTSYQQVLLDVKAEFSSSWWLLAATVSISSVATAIGRFAVGPIIDRIGEGRAVIPSLLVFGLGSLTAGLSSTVTGLTVGLAVQAFGIAPLSIVTSSLVAAMYPPADRGRVLGVSQAVSWVGPMAGPLLGSYLSFYMGWRSIFMVHALLCFLLMLPLWIAHYRLVQVSVLNQTKARWKWDPLLLCVSALGALHYFTLFTGQAFLPVLVRSQLGLDPRIAGWCAVALSVASMTAFPAGGRLADRAGGVIASLVGAALLVGGQALLTLAATLRGGWGPALLLPAVLVIGSATGLGLPAHLKLVVDQFPQAKASALGTYKLVQYMGGSAGPALAGALLASVGVGGAMGAIMALGLLMLVGVEKGLRLA